MAYNELEYGEGINQVLSKRYGVQGPPSPSMASEVFPMLVMGNDAPEWAFLQSERLGGGFAADPAVAGQFSHVGLQNRGGSGAIVRIDQIMIINDTTAALHFEVTVGTGDLVASASGENHRDSRWPVGAVTASHVFPFTNATAAGSPIGLVKVPPHDTFKWDSPVVLGPAGFCTVKANVANNPVLASFLFRERAATPGELQGALVQ